MAKLSLDDLNAASPTEFAGLVGGVFEHAPWVAAAVAGPSHESLAELFASMRQAVVQAAPEIRLELLRGHPELAGAAARSGNMTAESLAEQGRVGLSALAPAAVREFDELNGAYRARFGFPFIIGVRRHGLDSILNEFRRRLEQSPEAEIEAALEEVMRIAALRLDSLVAGPDRLPVTGRLSTHVLDTVHGVPAEGVAIELVEVAGDGDTTPVATAVTNAAGRTEAPLIAERPLPTATYELRFGLGDYFRRRGIVLPRPAFLDVVPIRFGIAEPEGHYHVPLVASPWSFQTYRGS